jgi:hypothetical protein
MLKLTKTKFSTFALALVLSSAFPSSLRADDMIEKEGVAVGLTLGNFVFLPAKYASVTVGLLAGAMSYILTGGNADLTKQIWRDTTEPPYLVTPELARKSIGERPLLSEKNQAAGSPTEKE